MSFRRSSIDKINNKYRASFAGKERIGNVAPSVFVGNVGQQALKRSFVQNIQEPQIVEKIQTRVPIEVNPRVVNENKITKVTVMIQIFRHHLQQSFQEKQEELEGILKIYQEVKGVVALVHGGLLFF
jgi:hypothetical protein